MRRIYFLVPLAVTSWTLLLFAGAEFAIVFLLVLIATEITIISFTLARNL